MSRSLAGALGLLVLQAACASPTDNGFLRTEVLQVAASMVPCVGVGPRSCMQVRHADNQPWTLFYDQIEGFTHVAGFQVTLRVAVYQVENPPADGSALRYRLLQELSRVAIGVEAVYRPLPTATASDTHPAMKHTPPNGVMAPSARTPVSAIA